MHNTNKLFTVATLLLASCPLLAAANFGYCTDNLTRQTVFRMGSTPKQGIAIRLDADKVKALSGHTIKGVNMAFGSSRTTGGTAEIFITSSLDGESTYTQTAKISNATKWCEITLDTPYTIGDEDTLYIGYTAEINTTSNLLMSDFEADSPGLSYAYSDGKWVDIYGLGYGNASIRLILDDDPEITDLMLKPVILDGYLKAGEEYELKGQLFNFGTNDIKSFDLDVTVGSADPVTVIVDNINIAQNSKYDITLPKFTAEAEGFINISVEVKNVNGGDDASPSDNTYSTDAFFYPLNMERSMLLEGFTGQDCHNCPPAHVSEAEFIEASPTPIIEVMHHAGYQPDLFTMDADADYTFFYGGGSQYAPAFMLNRHQASTLGTTPVSMVSASNLATAYNVVAKTEPYVSLSLESTLDPSTREVTVKVSTYTHNDLPSEDNVLNIFLVQNNMVSYQQPYGANYVHNCVFRGTLTGNSWGLLLDKSSTENGGASTWSKTFTLPEGIFSDYYNASAMSDEVVARYTHPVVVDNMYLVAYVGAYSNDCNGHTIYNAVSAPLGQSYVQGGFASSPDAAIDLTDSVSIKVVNGRIVVDGKYDTLTVYTVDGKAVSADQTLRKGIYIAKVTNGAKSTVAKLLVK